MTSQNKVQSDTEQMAEREKRQANTCWVVTDGKPGMKNQALGLAEALGGALVVKQIALRTPWRQFTPYLRWGLSSCLSSRGDQLMPPWPDLLIASGRQSILPALYVRRASQGKTFTVYIQNPVISPTFFNVVVAPKHDHLKGKNVISTQGALHQVTPARLAEEKNKFFGHFPVPRIAVLLGGTNRVYRFDASVAETMVTQLKNLQHTYKASLLISPSRRTDTQALEILQKGLGQENVYIWDGQGHNPYFALLAWADVILVTCDSVSMISEACSTSKPTYLLPLPGEDPKFSRFHHSLLERGHVQWFKGNLDFSHPSLPPFNETILVAHQVQKLLKLHTLSLA
jgi:mitochondrial fission protein ELM1